MRILLINTSERRGGPSIAAGRLMEALKNSGIKVKMLVRDKQSTRITVVPLDRSWKLLWDFLWERTVVWGANWFKRNNMMEVDLANTGTDITSLPEFRQADVIHLHWINHGMLSLKNIRKILASGKPVVWTMHDMWPCTGICHYAGDCTNYRDGGSCGNCHYLKSSNKRDLSNRVFVQKKKMFDKHRLTFVTCSRWLGERALSSTLLTGQTITTIPNPINTNLFKPIDRKESRAKCGLPAEGALLLFGSVKIRNKRKGVEYLIKACRLLAKNHPELIDTLGVVAIGHQSHYLERMIPFKVYALNYVENEHELVNIYNSVDIYVVPSLEENLPNPIMEAMACGVPCVGFNVGGIPEMINHLHNGYVADYKSVEDLAYGVHWVLTEGDYEMLSEQASRKVVAKYSERSVAKKYIDLYNKITGSHD